VKYPYFPSATRSAAHREDLPALSPPENLTLSDDNSDSDNHGQQGGDNVECDLTFEARCYSSEPTLLKKILKILFFDLNVPSKQVELSGSRLKGCNLLHHYAEVCLFRTRKNHIRRIFLSRKFVVFCIDVCCDIGALEHQNDPT